MSKLQHALALRDSITKEQITKIGRISPIVYDFLKKLEIFDKNTNENCVMELIEEFKSRINYQYIVKILDALSILDENQKSRVNRILGVNL